MHLKHRVFQSGFTVVGVLMLMLFASRWEIFPLGGLVGDEFEDLKLIGKLGDIAWHTVLPLIAYMVGAFTVMTFLMKNTLMDNLSSDYVRTAIAKGLPFRKAVFRHALRNSLIPIATGFGGIMTVMFAGSVIIEQVFEIPGMGRLSIEAIVGRDYAVFMGTVALTSLLGLVGRILSDFCYVLIDPRISFKG